MSALDKLIEAVEAGAFIQPTRPHQAEDDDCGDDWLSHPLLDLVPAGVLHIHQMGELVRAYHGSLDAALALHEALLPGWDWNTGISADKQRWVQVGQWEPFEYFEARHATPARAWLLAILRAHRANITPPAT